MIRTSAASIATIITLALAACDRAAGPDDGALARGTNTDTATTGTPGDPPPPPVQPPIDTALTPPYAGPIRLTVKVNAGVRNPQNPADTLNVSPLPGARVEVQGILQLAQSAPYGVTDANGIFVVDELPAGPYRVKVTPPEGSGISSAATVEILLQQADVTMPFTFFRSN